MRELALSFHCAGPRGRAQLLRLCDKCLPSELSLQPLLYSLSVLRRHREDCSETSRMIWNLQLHTKFEAGQSYRGLAIIVIVIVIFGFLCPRTHSVDHAALEVRDLPASHMLGLKVCTSTTWNYVYMSVPSSAGALPGQTHQI